MDIRKTRKCSFCGRPILCKCWFSDYGIVKLNVSGEMLVGFDACEECLEKIVKTVKDLFHDTN